jgi:hypothetical protein
MFDRHLKTLLLSVTRSIYEPIGRENWSDWDFDATSLYEFGRTSRLYDEGHKDHAFLELFRYVESQLRLTNYVLEGNLEKEVENFKKVTNLQAEGKIDEANRLLDTLDRAGSESSSRQQKVEHIINDLKGRGYIDDGQMYLLHALRTYRNEVIHTTEPTFTRDPDLDRGIYDALILLCVLMIKSLERVTKTALKRSSTQTP